MRIVVTGGAGFIGSHLAERFLKDGHRVYILDNFVTGKKQWVSAKKRLFVETIDITDTARLAISIKNIMPDLIVHAAAEYTSGTPLYRMIRTNTLATAALATLASDVEADMIYCQTALIYERTFDKISIDTQINAKSYYASTKLAGEILMRSIWPESVSVCMGNIYGPRNLTGPIPIFYRCLANGKKATIYKTFRDFVFIRDAINAYMEVIRDVSVYSGIGKRIHLGWGQATSMMDLFKTMGEVMGKQVEFEELDPTVHDTEMLVLSPHRIMNKVTQTPLSIGLEKAIAWYNSNLDGAFKPRTHLDLEKV